MAALMHDAWVVSTSWPTTWLWYTTTVAVVGAIVVHVVLGRRR